jgi:hypothetical protein
LRLVEAEPGPDRRALLLAQGARVDDPLGLERGLDLLPDSRHRAPGGRPHLGQVLDDRPQVGDTSDGEAEAV